MQKIHDKHRKKMKRKKPETLLRETKEIQKIHDRVLLVHPPLEMGVPLQLFSKGAIINWLKFL